MEITKDNYINSVKKMDELIDSIEKFENNNSPVTGIFEKMSKDLKKLKDSMEPIGIITDKGEILLYSNNTNKMGEYIESDTTSTNDMNYSIDEIVQWVYAVFKDGQLVTIYPDVDCMNVECEYISLEQLNEIQQIVKKYAGLDITGIFGVNCSMYITIS